MGGADEPATVADALAMLDRALAALAGADAGSLPTAVQAQALRALERAEARHTAARARILALLVQRILAPGSTRAATRHRKGTTLAAELGAAEAGYQPAYAAMDWLLRRPRRIANKLARP